MTIFSVGDFDGANYLPSSKTSNLVLTPSKGLTLLNYGDDFDDIGGTESGDGINSDRWTELISGTGSNVETTILTQTANPGSIIALALNAGFVHNFDFFITLDSSSLGQDSRQYIRLELSNNEYIEFGYEKIAGTLNYFFKSEDPSGLRVDTQIATTNTFSTFQLIRSFGSIYCYVDSSSALFLGSDNNDWSYLSLNLELITENNSAGIFSTAWSNFTSTKPYSLPAVWTSDIVDGTELIFWKKIELTAGSIPAHGSLYIRARTSDSPTNLATYSSYSPTRKFDPVLLVADIQSLVPTRRYLQFQLIFAYDSVPFDQYEIKQDYFTGNGILDQFELGFTPVDRDINLYEQGLTQFNENLQYSVDNKTVTFDNPPVNETHIIVEYRVPKIV